MNFLSSWWKGLIFQSLQKFYNNYQICLSSLIMLRKLQTHPAFNTWGNLLSVERLTLLLEVLGIWKARTGFRWIDADNPSWSKSTISPELRRCCWSAFRIGVAQLEDSATGSNNGWGFRLRHQLKGPKINSLDLTSKAWNWSRSSVLEEDDAEEEEWLPEEALTFCCTRMSFSK